MGLHRFQPRNQARGGELRVRQDRATGQYVLANGFAACEEPERLQAICNDLAPQDIQAFFDRWLAVIPTPLAQADHEAGYWWELSMRQVEVSRTLVLNDPRRARAFFESLVADNIGIGRPNEVAAVFARQVRKNTPGIFRTRIFGVGTDVKIDFHYKKSRVKQYLKEGKAIRVETVINDPRGPRHPAPPCPPARVAEEGARRQSPPAYD